MTAASNQDVGLLIRWFTGAEDVSVHHKGVADFYALTPKQIGIVLEALQTFEGQEAAAAASPSRRRPARYDFAQRRNEKSRK